MTELGQDTLANLITVVVAVSTAIAANWSQIRGQTRQLRRMLRKMKQESHTDLEALRARVDSVEVKVGRLVRQKGPESSPPAQSGGDPEVGHLPPSSG